MYGNEQWERFYGDSFSDDTGYSLKKTSDNGFIVTGTKTSFSTGLTDIWLIKTDNNGYMQWNLTIDGGEDDWSYSVDETTDGGYIITGLTNSYGSGGYDLWLIKVELENSENQPPNIPSGPNPPDNSNFVDVNADLSWNCSDPDGDNIFFDVYFEADNPEPDIKVSDSQSVNFFDPGRLLYGTDYYWQIIAKDEHGASTPGSIWHFTTKEASQNEPPNTPVINGPSSGKPGNSYTYTFTSTDPDGDDVSYYIDWDDGNTSGWTALQTEGTPYSESHTWSSAGTYTITAKAKDKDGLEGPTSESQVTIEKSKEIAVLNSLLIWFLQQFPLFRLLLQRLD
jgi:hypothetical protein